MSSTKRTLILVFAALGLCASLASSYVHYRLLTDVTYASFCDVSTTVSCTQAYLSRYGSIFGVPVAIGGVLFFAAVLLLTGVAGRPGSPARETAPAYTFALSTLALAMVLYLAWASYFVLGVFCILCAFTYVSVIAIFIISGGATPIPMTALPGRAGRDLRTLATSPLALVLTGLFAVLAVSAFVIFPHGAAATASAAATAAALPPVSDEDRANLTKWWDVQTKTELPIAADGAKVVVVKFNDYQCPGCKATYDAYKGVLAKYVASGEVKYVTKHFPLESECNPYANAGHQASCEASAAVIMSRGKGTTEKLEDWIFGHLGPPLLTPAEVKDAARTVGGITDFDAQYPRALEEIRADAALGSQLKVQTTPTFYINGKKPGMLAPQYFDALIQLELQRSK